MAALAGSYDRNLSRKARAALRGGARLLVTSRDSEGYFSVYKLAEGQADALLGVTDDERLADLLDAELEAGALDADEELEGLTTAQLRTLAGDAERELRHADATRFLRAAIARHPGDPQVSGLAARDLAALRERLALAESASREVA